MFRIAQLSYRISVRIKGWNLITNVSECGVIVCLHVPDPWTLSNQEKRYYPMIKGALSGQSSRTLQEL